MDLSIGGAAGDVMVGVSCAPTVSTPAHNNNEQQNGNVNNLANLVKLYGMLITSCQEGLRLLLPQRLSTPAGCSFFVKSASHVI
jgi:hypothetical protein